MNSMDSQVANVSERREVEMDLDGEKKMPTQQKAIAFDLDLPSLLSLRRAFPEWTIEVVQGATAASLCRDWTVEAANLLVVGAYDDARKTLDLCRGLRSQLGREATPLLALVRPEQSELVTDLLEAGANSCLVLPVHYKDLADMLERAQAGNRPGRKTLNLDRAQIEDSWRDNGGQG